MEYYGLIAFCVGFGWIPVMIIAAAVFMLVEGMRGKKK